MGDLICLVSAVTDDVIPGQKSTRHHKVRDLTVTLRHRGQPARNPHGRYRVQDLTGSLRHCGHQATDLLLFSSCITQKYPLLQN